MPFTTRSGVAIWYDVAGSGPPLLLIQGLGYPADACWRIAPELASEHTVILIDNRGVGRSDAPLIPWRIEDMASDAAAVLDELRMTCVNVAGFSMGGLIAEELALSRPDLVNTLILGCTSPGGPDAIGSAPEVAEAFANWANLSPEDAAWREATVCYSPETPQDAIRADIRARLVRPTLRRGYLHQLQAVGRHSGTGERLRAGWHRPTLIVHGEADRIVPVANAHVLRECLPQAELMLVPGAGHILMTDAHHELVQAINSFTSRHACEHHDDTPAALGG